MKVTLNDDNTALISSKFGDRYVNKNELRVLTKIENFKFNNKYVMDQVIEGYKNDSNVVAILPHVEGGAIIVKYWFKFRPKKLVIPKMDYEYPQQYLNRFSEQEQQGPIITPPILMSIVTSQDENARKAIPYLATIYWANKDFSRIQHLPFNNVYDDNHICWGENETQFRQSSPDLAESWFNSFFGTPFNTDLIDSDFYEYTDRLKTHIQQSVKKALKKGKKLTKKQISEIKQFTEDLDSSAIFYNPDTARDTDNFYSFVAFLRHLTCITDSIDFWEEFYETMFENTGYAGHIEPTPSFQKGI